MNCRTLCLLLAGIITSSVLPESPDPSAGKYAGERGNWVKKREWVKQAQVSNDQLEKDVLAVKSRFLYRV